MKRFLIIALAILSVLAFAACGKKESAPTTPPATQAPTDAPYIDTQINEPEWTLAEGVLQLEGGDTVYVDNSGILYFAIVTNNDGTQELRFRLDDAAAAKMKAQDPENEYFITLNGEKIGKVTLNDDCTVATIKQDDAEGSITALASKIRGLA